MGKKTPGSEPAEPSTQAAEVFVTEQHVGLTKRERAAIASLEGQRASGKEATSEEVGKLAWADADALFATSGKGASA